MALLSSWVSVQILATFVSGCEYTPYPVLGIMPLMLPTKPFCGSPQIPFFFGVVSKGSCAMRSFSETVML